MCTGFIPNGNAHYLLNNTSESVIYLEVGDREHGDQVTYPEDDLVAVSTGDNQWQFARKDGNNYRY